MIKFDNRRPTSFALAKPNAVRKLEDDAGIVGRFMTKHETRKDAGKALTELKRAEVEAATRIGKTNIAIAEAALSGAMVAEGLTSIAVLAVDINTRTGSAVSKITAATGSELIGHVNNRSQAYSAINARQQQKLLTDDEAAGLKSYVDAALVADTEAAVRRSENSKAAVEALNDMALAGLRHAARFQQD